MLTRVAILRASCLKPTTDLRLATSILNELLTMPKRRVRLLCGMVVIDTTENMRTVLAVAFILAMALLGVWSTIAHDYPNRRSSGLGSLSGSRNRKSRPDAAF